MINILLNLSNFDESWAYPSLARVITPGSHVLILPLSFHESWITDAFEWQEHYGRGSEEYEDIIRPFVSYGVKEKEIRWINYYEDDHESCLRKIRWADILFFTGGYPDWMLQRLYDLGIKEEVSRFEGTVIGTSAGALIQLEQYHLTPEEDYEYQYQEGLGMLSGFDVDVHFEEDLKHVEALIRTLEDTGMPVIAMPNRGGVLIEGDYFELLGEAFIVDQNDLDDLYGTYDYLRQSGGWPQY